MSNRALTIGTRGSKLALEQARRVQAGLDGPSAIEIIHTGGDRFTEQPLGEANPIGFFTKEIEDALKARQIDLAVHSLKDLPTRLGPGLDLGAMLVRDDPADILLVTPAALDPAHTLPLKSGATIGASSRRRQALLLDLRPDVVPRPIRGNVTTRIEKALRGEYDAIILSRAGLTRLGLAVEPLLAFELNPARWPGAPGQAVIAVEIRSDDEEVRARLFQLDHAETRLRVEAERSLLQAFGGGCHAPFGAHCALGAEGAVFTVAAPAPDGALRLAHFGAAALETARAEAEAWIRAGRPPRPGAWEDTWLYRRARPWC